MRGLQPMNVQAEPAQNPAQSILTPQNIQLLAQAYKGYMAGQPTGMGDLGTSYPNSPDPSAGTGFGLGQPLVSGGLSDQPMMGDQPSSSSSNPSYQSLIQALSRLRN